MNSLIPPPAFRPMSGASAIHSEQRHRSPSAEGEPSGADAFHQVLEDVRHANPPETDGEPRIHEAARNFEALLIGQLIRSAQGDSGWFGSGDDQSCSALMEMGAECFASALSAGGGLGIAAMVSRSLAVESATPTSRGTPKTP